MQGFHVVAGSELMAPCWKTQHLVWWVIIPATRRALGWLDSHLMISLQSLMESTEQMDHWPYVVANPLLQPIGKAWKACSWICSLYYGVFRTHDSLQTKRTKGYYSFPAMVSSLEYQEVWGKNVAWLVLRWKSQRSIHMLSWAKTPGQMRLGAFKALKGSSLTYCMVSLMESVTISVRDMFLSYWPWLYSLCFEERWPDICLRLSASMALNLNSLSTSAFYITMTGII